MLKNLCLFLLLRIDLSFHRKTKNEKNKNLVHKYLLMTTHCKFVLFSIIINITFFWKCLLNVLTFLGWGCWKCMFLMYINNNKPFIDLKCTYYTRTTALWKFNYDSQRFLQQKLTLHITTNITHEIQLLSEVKKKM